MIKRAKRNVSGEETKYGFSSDELEDIIEDIAKFRNLRTKGLMTIAPFCEDSKKVRPVFTGLKSLSKKLAARELKGIEMSCLSMGMSQDFEVAIEEGSTSVRIGSAIFGDREV